ncbi:HlyD family efflux transporter periplasmic adaptor subunit [Methylobacterium tardum]|uniref:HlyD family secretion protein n=1 Tax=Methylobacterium tardum TaxID=374432 RepID=UPI003616D1D0
MRQGHGGAAHRRHRRRGDGRRQPAGEGRRRDRAPRRPVLSGPAQAGRGRGRQGPGAGARRRRGDRPAAGAGRLVAGRPRQCRGRAHLLPAGIHPLPEPAADRLGHGPAPAAGGCRPAPAPRRPRQGRRLPGRRAEADRQPEGPRGQHPGESRRRRGQGRGVKLDLSYTTIVAPIDGVAGDRALRIGQVVSPGTGLLTLVPMGRDIYLVANFKETQTGHMVEGERVTFTVDAFGDHEFQGRIESFSPGTGSQFALLPPENATGNFTKVVQRVPVRVALDPADPLVARLRPGLSVEATVHTADPVEPVDPARHRPKPAPAALVSEALPQ